MLRAPRRRPSPRSVLALDVGRRRIGLAGCDPLGLTVTPLPALHRRAYDIDLEQLRKLARQRHVQALVVGLPLDAAGHTTPQAIHCRRYGERLGLSLTLPVAWVNEQCSSWAAAEHHGLQGDRSGALDSAAAALLLEQWLAEGPDAEPISAATIGGDKADRLDPS